MSNPAQTTYYYHGDQIGSSRLMTSGSGWPVWQGTFLPYGEEYNPQIGTNHYKFTGKERDDESGLDYFGARYYGSALGRFASVDPINIKQNRLVDPQRLNLYAYAVDNPLRYIDPDGRDGLDWVKGVAIGVVRFVGGPLTSAYDQSKQSVQDAQYALKHGVKAYNEMAYQRTRTQLKAAGTVVAAVSGNQAAQAQVVQGAVNHWNSMSTTDKVSAGTETALSLVTFALTLKAPVPSGAALETTTLTEGTIFRSGGTNPANITGVDLSFRDSLSNPIDSAANPVFGSGDKYFGVDVEKLPPGSAVLDNQPPGHVTVNAPADAIKDAVTVKGKLPR